jgi:hypothetical protein
MGVAKGAAMVQSFQYRIDGALPELKVQIWQRAWPRLTKALVWSAAWALLAYICFRMPRAGVLPVIGAIVSLLFCWAGLSIANYSVKWSTLCLGPDALRLRVVRLFTRETKYFLTPAIRDFGFGLYSHSGNPVLKLDADGTWFVLADGVREDEVFMLLSDIRQRGYCFPDGRSQRKSDTYPSFWTTS